MDSPIHNIDNTEDELTARAELAKRALDFIKQKNQKNVGSQPNHVVNPHERHRGVVTDPAHDKRLKQNKEDSKTDDEGGDDRIDILENEDKNRKERILQNLESIAPHKTASSFVIKPKKPMGANPSQSDLTNHPIKGLGDHAKALGGPGQWSPEHTQNVYQKLQQHDKYGPILRGHGASEADSAPKIAELKNNPTCGPMITAILKYDSFHKNDIVAIREKLQKSLEKVSEISRKNDILMALSITAELLLNMDS